MSIMPRVQTVVLPILRGHNDLSDNVSVLPALEGVKIGTWVEDIDYREFPQINLRRLGGLRHDLRPTQFSRPVIEMTAYHSLQAGGSVAATETIYENALEALYEAVRRQTQTPSGYLHSIRETMGATQFSSLFQDSWRVQGLIQLGLRPPRA